MNRGAGQIVQTVFDCRFVETVLVSRREGHLDWCMIRCKRLDVVEEVAFVGSGPDLELRFKLRHIRNTKGTMEIIVKVAPLLLGGVLRPLGGHPETPR